MAERVRIMTHNVWNCDANCPKWQEKGEDCSAAARVGAHLRVYRETMPDVIGGQEVSALMADLMKEGFQKEAVSYTLIWGRFTASQMANAVYDNVVIDAECAGHVFRANHSEIKFPG